MRIYNNSSNSPTKKKPSSRNCAYTKDTLWYYYCYYKKLCRKRISIRKKKKCWNRNPVSAFNRVNLSFCWRIFSVNIGVLKNLFLTFALGILKCTTTSFLRDTNRSTNESRWYENNDFYVVTMQFKRTSYKEKYVIDFFRGFFYFS